MACHERKKQMDGRASRREVPTRGRRDAFIVAHVASSFIHSSRATQVFLGFSSCGHAPSQVRGGSCDVRCAQAPLGRQILMVTQIQLRNIIITIAVVLSVGFFALLFWAAQPNAPAIFSSGLVPPPSPPSPSNVSPPPPIPLLETLLADERRQKKSQRFRQSTEDGASNNVDGKKMVNGKKFGIMHGGRGAGRGSGKAGGKGGGKGGGGKGGGKGGGSKGGGKGGGSLPRSARSSGRPESYMLAKSKGKGKGKGIGRRTVTAKTMTDAGVVL